MDTPVQVTGVFDATEEAGSGHGVARLFVELDPQAYSAFTVAQQGRGELAAGRGPTSAGPGNYLPAALTEMRIWAGAMTQDQIGSKVMGEPGVE